MASLLWGSTVRDYFACETVFFDGGWMNDVIVHDGPLCRGGFVEVPDGPGLGIELDPDVVSAHLAPGETWWGVGDHGCGGGSMGKACRQAAR